MSLVVTQTAMAQRGTVVVTVGNAETHDFIGQAQVSLVEVDVTRQTDIVGQAHFADLPARVYTVRARRLGFAPLEASVALGGGDTVEVRMMMRPVPAELPGVTVTDESTAPWLREFDRRRLAASGRFVTSAQIRAAMGSDIGNVVTAAIPGVYTTRDISGAVKVFSRRGANNFGGECQVEVYIDGVRLQSGNAAELPLEFLGGIEYHTPATVPVQYKTMSSKGAGGSSACGTLLLWTGSS